MLYAYATVIAIQTAWCLGHAGCHPSYGPELNDGIINVLTVVGGLVAALVVAELAAAQPGQAPAARLMAAINVAATTKSVVKWISVAYILVWLVCGVAEVMVGYLWYPDVVPTLTASAKSWFGIAVAAAYSYLGIRQP